jgi:hypothetical protein
MLNEDLRKVEARIAKKAQGSLMYALLGIFCFTGIILWPLAFIRANQALRLIDKYQIGKQYRGKANAARIIAVIVPLVFVVIVAFYWLLYISAR